VIVENVSNSNGNVSIAVYNNEHGFLEFNHVFLSNSSKAIKGITVVNLAHVPTGTYALAVFHDENSNEKLDTNFFGIPKESVGFSNSKMKTFGPPSFKECSFRIDSDKEIIVTIK
jgi:uncharacterized protein (DUF2141 family)